MLEPGPPKWGSRRTIHLPADLVEILRGSMAAIGDGNVFTSKQGKLLRRSNSRRRIWLPAVDRSGSNGQHQAGDHERNPYPLVSTQTLVKE